jgi:hypothetical protein
MGIGVPSKSGPSGNDRLHGGFLLFFDFQISPILGGPDEQDFRDVLFSL